MDHFTAIDFPTKIFGDKAPLALEYANKKCNEVMNLLMDTLTAEEDRVFQLTGSLQNAIALLDILAKSEYDKSMVATFKGILNDLKRR